jgi:hypothetical protein
VNSGCSNPLGQVPRSKTSYSALRFTLASNTNHHETDYSEPFFDNLLMSAVMDEAIFVKAVRSRRLRASEPSSRMENVLQ